MATAKPKQPPVGSLQWIQTEREQVAQFVDQEVEEFGFSARNELEWLNEHMSEIFNRTNLNFTDVFKTPGKLRGKTPRTARRKDPQASRAPLTDLFAPNPQSTMSPAQRTPFFNKVAQFKVAEDGVDPKSPRSTSRRSPKRVGQGNADSGYHGLTEDEMEVDGQYAASQLASQQQVAQIMEENARSTPHHLEVMQDVDDRPTDDSFVSAKEGLESANPSTENLGQEDDLATVPDDEMETEDKDIAVLSGETAEETQEIRQVQEDESGDAEITRTPSDASSPEKPLLRKSSLNFASLPPRETLTAKQSLGRNSIMGKSFGGRGLGIVTRADSDDDEEMEHSEPLALAAEHNKSTTQRLHERINMLGQSKEPRASHSIASLATIQPSYPRLDNLAAPMDHQAAATTADGEQEDDEDESWIAPISNRPSGTSAVAENSAAKDVIDRDQTTQTRQQSPSRPTYGHQKSISTTNIASPTKASMAPEILRQKALSVSHPNLSYANGEVQHSTPAGSPESRKLPDGPLSASKSRLYSVFKSAKSIFASSAGASAQARIEALSSPTRPQLHSTSSSGDPDMSKMPGGLYDDVPLAPKPAVRPETTSSPSKDGRKTRSSTESEKKRDKEAREKQRAADDLDKAREQERKRAAAQKQQEIGKAEREQTARQALSRANSQRSATEEQTSADEMPPPAAPRSMLPAGKARAPGRLGKPTKQPAQPSRPAPQLIRVASQSQRLGSVQPSASVPPSSAHEPTPPPALTRQQSAATRAGSVPVSGKAAPTSNARVKALEAAARKKALEEKAAQAKAEQKREIERKRAAKADEDRRLEQERKAAEQELKAAEQKRAQEAKLAAQKQAEQRRLEQQRREAALQQAKADAELAAALERERAQASLPHPRGDVQGTLRQLGKVATASEVIQAAKNAKRPMQEDSQTQRPGLQRGPPSYQQQDAKRRKTNDEEDVDMQERHSVMAPPKRPSNMRKETLTKFPHGYAHAPPPANHHAPSMFKSTVAAQHQLQHAGKAPAMHPNDMVKLSNARIPFAENANPSAVQAGHQQMNHHYTETTSKSAFKTPARPQQAHKNLTKSSPAYPNGENIALPEINTDSEDEEDSEDEATGGFRAPSWVASPALRDLLTQQQLVDPESVFGPIAPLQMDEVFKNGKNADRLKRFRDRGSSARWVESGDAVTSEEKRRDREARARVVRDGGWSFQKDV